jgi:hypothetical protein
MVGGSIVKRLIPLLVILTASIASAQTVTITSTKLQDSAKNKYSGVVMFQPTLSSGLPTSYRMSGGGATTAAMIQVLSTAGAFTIAVPDTTQTSPANICFKLVVPGIVKGYDCLQPHYTALNAGDWCQAGTCNLDNYPPNLAPQVTVQTGPQGPPGVNGGVNGVLGVDPIHITGGLTPTASCPDCVQTAPTASQVVQQPTGTQFGVVASGSVDGTETGFFGLPWYFYEPTQFTEPNESDGAQKIQAPVVVSSTITGRGDVSTTGAVQDLNGVFSLGGLALGNIPVTTSQSITFVSGTGGGFNYLANATSGAISLTLPDATLPVATIGGTFTSFPTPSNPTAPVTQAAASTYPIGQIYVFKKTDSSANAVTITAAAGQTIDGAAAVNLTAQNQYIIIQSNGSGASAATGWSIIGATPNPGTLTAVTATAPVDCTTSGSSVNCAMAQATSSVDGYLSHIDWAAFNAKQNALTNPVTGTGTTGYYSLLTGASTIGNGHLDDGVTTAGVITSTEPIAIPVTGPLYGNGQSSAITLETNAQAQAALGTFSQYGLLTSPTNTSVGSLLPSNWTTGHQLLTGYLPLGSPIAPTIVDANTLNVNSALNVQCYASDTCPTDSIWQAPVTATSDPVLTAQLNSGDTTMQIATLAGVPITGHMVTAAREEIGYTFDHTSGGNSIYNITRGHHGTTPATATLAGPNLNIVTSESANCTTCGVNWQTTGGRTAFGQQGNPGLGPNVLGDYGIFRIASLTQYAGNAGEFYKVWTGGAIQASGYSAASFEPALGNPGTNGYVLSSTTGGTRSWIAPTSGGGTVTTSGSPVSPNIAAFSSSTAITAATSANIQTAIGASVYDAYGAAAARQANLSLLPGTYTNGDMCTYNSSGTLLNCNTAIPTVGSWGALNYPTWASGTPFVKMSASGTFALDTNTYLTSSAIASTSNLLSGDGSGNAVSSGIAASNVPRLNAANTFTNGPQTAPTFAATTSVTTPIVNGAPISWFGSANANIGGGLPSNTTGSNNTASGLNALYSNTTGYNNTANGMNALSSNTTGNFNTANGMNALYSNTTGNFNTANGSQALSSNTTGNSNTANGLNALVYNTTGYNNTANGLSALVSNTTGNSNTANGMNALYSNTTGYNNTANGLNAGRFIADGVTANATSSNSLYDGYFTEALADGDTNENVIGNQAVGHGSNTTTIGNSSITDTYLQGTAHIGASTVCLTDGTGCPPAFGGGGTSGCSVSGLVWYEFVSSISANFPTPTYHKAIFGSSGGCVGTVTISLPTFAGPQGVFYSNNLSTGVTVTSLSSSSVTLTSATSWSVGTAVIEGW